MGEDKDNGKRRVRKREKGEVRLFENCQPDAMSKKTKRLPFI